MKLYTLTIVLILLPIALSACGSSEPETAASALTEAVAPKDENHGEAGQEEKSHEEGGHEESKGGLTLKPEQLKAAGIELAAIGPAQIRETLPLYGAVAPNAERVREAAARFPGVIRGVNRKIGDAVQQGDVLATVESNESLQTYSVTAPLAGVIIARSANPGEQTGDKALFTVADLSTVWVELSLFPRDVAKVRVGQSVRVKSPDSRQSAEGNLVYVAPFGQAANQTLIARVLLDNPERRWAPGLYVTAEVTLAETPVPLAVRNEAVQNLEGRDVIFVQEDHGLSPYPVQLGRSDGEHSELLSGPGAGERYVTKNSYILKADLGKGSAEHED